MEVAGVPAADDGAGATPRQHELEIGGNLGNADWAAKNRVENEEGQAHRGYVAVPHQF